MKGGELFWPLSLKGPSFFPFEKGRREKVEFEPSPR
jgi:hypothetical protein